MAVVVMLVFVLFLGHGPLYPVQVIGSLLFGDAALVGTHVGAIVAGLLLHQGGPALFWSIMFGLGVHAWRVSGTARLVALGLAVGVLSQLVDVNLMLPPIMKALHGRDIWAAEVPAFWSWRRTSSSGSRSASSSQAFDDSARELGRSPSVPPRSAVRSAVGERASTARSTAAASASRPSEWRSSSAADEDRADRVGDAAAGDVGRRAVDRLVEAAAAVAERRATASRPSEPASTAASSVRMSPNMFSVTTTSNCAGVRDRGASPPSRRAGARA